MLAFAAGLVTGALMLVEANQEQTLTIRLVYYGLAYLALFGIAHTAVRKWAPYADPLILPCVALLNGLGLVMIYRLDLAYAERATADRTADFENTVPKQILWTTIALVLFLVVLYMIKDHRTLTRYGYTFGLVGLFLLALPAVLPGVIAPTLNGAKIWLRVGPVSIQPGEFAKILLLIFFAAFLVSKRDLFMAAGRRVMGIDLPRARDLGPILFCWAVSRGRPGRGEGPGHLAAVLRHRAGDALRGHRARHLGRRRARACSSAAACSPTSSSTTCRCAWRTGSTRSPTTTPAATRSRSRCSASAPAGSAAPASAPAGRTWCRSRTATSSPRRSARSSASSGSPRCCWSTWCWRCAACAVAVAVRDTFGKLLGGGLSFALVMQVFVVVGGVTKLIPMTGITAPFLSAGGSSLLANYVLVALLLRISDAARRPQTGAKPKPVQQVPIAEAGTVMVERPS